MNFASPPLQQGCSHSQRLPAPRAAAGANQICVRAAEAFPRTWVLVQSPRPTPPIQSYRGACTCTALLLLCAHTLQFIPSAQDGPSPHAATGACRLCGSSSPCSCCPCLVQFCKSASLFKYPQLERHVPKGHCRSTPDWRSDLHLLHVPTRCIVQIKSTSGRPAAALSSHHQPPITTHPLPFTSAYHSWVCVHHLRVHPYTSSSSSSSSIASFQDVAVRGSTHTSFQLSLPTKHVKENLITGVAVSIPRSPRQSAKICGRSRAV